jgi:protein-disulfide isomerase
MANLSNSSAAAVLAMTILACSPSQSAPPANNGAPAAATSASSATSTAQQDPLVTAADRGRIEGDANAKTWLIVASDFQCPFCKQWHDESYKTVYDEYVRSG